MAAQSEQTRERMRHLATFALGVCLSVTRVAWADIPADSERSAEQAKKETEFRQLAEMAEKARLSKQYNDAALLYSKALELQRTPIALGRFGLVLMKLGQVAYAGELLHVAVEHGQGVSPKERREVTEAYDKAKSLTTWVNVDVSQAGARITYDGQTQNRGGYSAFWMFTMPGEHTLRAQLDGYQDAVVTFTGKPGEEITISLKLVPLADPMLPELPAPVAVTVPDNRVFPPMLRASNIAGDSNYDPREDPSYGEPKDPKPEKKKTGPRFSISGGVVTVFGVASWNPAVGGVVGVGLRPNDYFSIGLEGRAAWLTTGVADRPISAMTAGGILSACGHVKWFFGCGLGYIGTINIEFSDLVYTGKSYSLVQPGFGGRIGAEARLGSAALLRANVDVLGMARGIDLSVGNQIIASQAPVMIDAQISGGWEF